MRVYKPDYFKVFSPANNFERWAAVEVGDGSISLRGFEKFELSGGLYAVFRYKGMASEAGEAFRHIYMEWLPSSGYIPDDRPHFDVLGKDYRPDDPEAEEDLYIPILKRQ